MPLSALVSICHFVQNMMLYFIPASIGLYRCWRSMGRPMICLCSVRFVPCIQAENGSRIFLGQKLKVKYVFVVNGWSELRFALYGL